jgi:hypothetical protein
MRPGRRSGRRRRGSSVGAGGLVEGRRHPLEAFQPGRIGQVVVAAGDPFGIVDSNRVELVGVELIDQTVVRDGAGRARARLGGGLEVERR